MLTLFPTSAVAPVVASSPATYVIGRCEALLIVAIVAMLVTDPVGMLVVSTPDTSTTLPNL